MLCRNLAASCVTANRFTRSAGKADLSRAQAQAHLIRGAKERNVATGQNAVLSQFSNNCLVAIIDAADNSVLMEWYAHELNFRGLLRTR
jgi:DNA-binding GntR family transcriptional regulator